MLQRCNRNSSLTSLVTRLMASTAPHSAAGRRYTPPNIARSSSSRATPNSKDTDAGPSRINRPNHAQATDQVASPGICTNMGQQANPDGLRILFGVKGPSPALRLEQIEIKDATKDSDFYDQLRKHYKLNRGRFRYWLSFWRLGYCEVVKVRHKSL
jgi:hypothetical protein